MWEVLSLVEKSCWSKVVELFAEISVSVWRFLSSASFEIQKKKHRKKPTPRVARHMAWQACVGEERQDWP